MFQGASAVLFIDFSRVHALGFSSPKWSEVSKEPDKHSLLMGILCFTGSLYLPSISVVVQSTVIKTV